MSVSPCGTADAALAVNEGASGANDEIVRELQPAGDEHPAESGEELADDESDEDRQVGEGIPGDTTQQYEALKVIANRVRNKMSSAQCGDREDDLKSLDDAVRAADAAWDALDADAAEIPAGLWAAVVATTTALHEMLSGLLERWKLLGKGHTRYRWWRDVRREHPQDLKAAQLAEGIQTRMSVWDRRRGRAPPQQWAQLRRRARADIARVIDGLEARTGTHAIAIMYDEPTGRFETTCTKAVTGFAKGACVLDSMYYYLGMQRCLQRANELTGVNEVRFDALPVSYQRNAVRVLASLMTKEGTRRQTNPFMSGVQRSKYGFAGDLEHYLSVWVVLPYCTTE
jgi:hypothetical protein